MEKKEQKWRDYKAQQLSRLLHSLQSSLLKKQLGKANDTLHFSAAHMVKKF